MLPVIRGGSGGNKTLSYGHTCPVVTRPVRTNEETMPAKVFPLTVQETLI
jgi:hypothetical protein